MFMFNKKFMVAVALAQTIGPPTSPPPTTDFFGYAQFLYPFALSVAAVLAVIMLIIAGLEMMTASEGLRSDAKQKIWGAVLGLLLAVGSYLILNTINPDLVKLKLNPPKVNVQGSGQQQPGSGAINCPAFRTQVECQAAASTCQWDATSQICRRQIFQTPSEFCANYGWALDACVRDSRCKWSGFIEGCVPR